MSILSDTYIFYADVYFIQNFMIKIAVLYLSLLCNRFHDIISAGKGIRKIIFAACVGTLLEIVGLLSGNSYNLFILLIHIIEIPFMMKIVLGKEYKQMFPTIISGYFFIMLINAVLEMLWNWFGEYGNYIFWLGISCALIYVGFHIYSNYKRLQKGIFSVEITHGNKRISTYGFYDSGNQLIDPYTKKGVHIISEHLWKKIGLDKENAVLVPYQALGNADGMVKVYYVEEFVVGDEKQRKRWSNCPLGVTKENLFKEGKYEIILNEEVF